MKRFIIEQSDADIISHCGLSPIGQAIKHHTSLTPEINTQVPLRYGTKHSDVIKSYLAMVCVGKNDFEAVSTIKSENYLMSAMDIDDIPREAKLPEAKNCFVPVSLLVSCLQDFVDYSSHIRR